MKKLSFYAFALLWGVLSSVLCACHSGKSTQKEGDKASLKLGVMPSLDHLPIAYAQSLGIYDSLGLQLELVPFTSPMERDVALQTGNIDASVTDYTSAMLQHAAGITLKLGMKTASSFVLVAPHLELQALRGGVVPISSRTVIDYATDKMLQELGLGSDDLKRIEVQKVPQRLEMLRSGELTAAVLPEPMASRAIVASSLEYKVFGEGVTGIVFTDKGLQNPKCLELLCRGYELAQERILRDADAWYAFVAQTLDISPEIARALRYPNYTQGVEIQPRDLDNMKAWLVGKGLISADYDASSLIVSPSK